MGRQRDRNIQSRVPHSTDDYHVEFLIAYRHADVDWLVGWHGNGRLGAPRGMECKQAEPPRAEYGIIQQAKRLPRDAVAIFEAVSTRMYSCP